MLFRKAQNIFSRLVSRDAESERAKSGEPHSRTRKSDAQEKLERERALLQASPLMDLSYYRESNPDVTDYSETALVDHYLLYGGFEGRKPHVLFDSTFYLSQNKELADQRQSPLVHYLTAAPEERCRPHLLFDESHYLQQVREPVEIAPLAHFLTFGVRNGLSPHPLFDSKFYRQKYGPFSGDPLSHYVNIGAAAGADPSRTFDRQAYCTRYADVGEASEDPLIHYITRGELEGRLARKFDSIAEATTELTRPEFRSALSACRASTVAPVSHVIVLGALQRGGTERSACSYLRVLAELVSPQQTLLVITDNAHIDCKDWLPDGVQIANLPGLDATLTFEERAVLLLDLLQRVEPLSVIGMSSALFFQAFDAHQNLWTRELRSTVALYLGGFEGFVEQNDWGLVGGPIERLSSKLDLIITDNDRLAESIKRIRRDVVGIKSKVVSVKKALTPELHANLTRIERSPEARNILWAGRLAIEKQPQMLAAIARGIPDRDIIVYGRNVNANLTCLHGIPNVRLMGEFADFASIDFSEIALFLHTSAADGIANVLLEAAAAHLPIVTPDIGGTRELLSENECWFVEDKNDPDAFIQTLKTALADKNEREARAERAHKAYLDKCTWTMFVEQLKSVPLWSHSARHS